MQGATVAKRSYELIGNSPAIRTVRSRISRFARFREPVMITGESGTGKELVARKLHEESGRKGEFVPISCSTLSPHLVESELFGHAKGSFNDASEDTVGLFAAANNGTLFLDEISDADPRVQVVLLRAIGEREIIPVGAIDPLELDVRIVSAVSNLPEALSAGRFREDLYYRLGVLDIELPPLRNRIEDVPALIDHLFALINEDYGGRLKLEYSVFVEIIQKVPDLRGNIRELRNLIERTAVLSSSEPMQTAVESLILWNPFSIDIRASPSKIAARLNELTGKTLEELGLGKWKQELRDFIERTRIILITNLFVAGFDAQKIADELRITRDCVFSYKDKKI